MTWPMIAALVAALLAAAFLDGGIYTTTASGRGPMYRTNRFTGAIALCETEIQPEGGLAILCFNKMKEAGTP